MWRVTQSCVQFVIFDLNCDTRDMRGNSWISDCSVDVRQSPKDNLWSLSNTDMWLLRWMWHRPLCNVWSVICDICDCSAECDSVTLWHRPMCDLWSLGWQARSTILCSPMCDASQLVVTTNRPNIDPPFVRCAQYRKYRPAISPRFDGKK